MLENWSPSRKLATLVLLVVLAAFAVSAASGGKDETAGAPADGATTTIGPTGADGGEDGTTTTAAATSTDSSDDGGSTPLADAPLPVEATVTNTTNLHDLDEVRIAVTADDGSLVYAVEARLCRAGAVIRNDGDMLPTVTGQCAAHALSPGADAFLQTPGEPPFHDMVASFKVGTGTDTFPLDDGGTAKVTCDAAHPCVLAVKYQIPDGFGFRTYALTFA